MANAVSVTRAIMALPIIVAAVAHNYQLAATLAGASWATDMIDGPIARKSGKAGGDVDIDGISDFVLTLGTYAGLFWLPLGLDHPVALAITLGEVLALTGIGVAYSKNSPLAVTINMVICHGIVSILVVPLIYFVTAFGGVGWLWLVPMLILAVVRWPKLKTWIDGSAVIGQG
ncbi:MAG TPA: CDP-alcohol phosphatidyltransferase family protein [Candidatus Saccharimonadales bacterium]|nr:CDP-alcohol phosphatidyltransferase family protein [Candidatus Saccharimonadales bacterium]